MLKPSFCSAWSSYPTFKTKILKAITLSEGKGDVSWPQWDVRRLKKQKTCQLKEWMGLTIGELKSASGRDYIPSRYLMGPTLMLNKLCGTGKEMCYMFPHPSCPYRIIREVIEEGEETCFLAQPAKHDLWPGKASEHLAAMRKERCGADGTKELLDRVQPMNSFPHWLEQAAVAETQATITFLTTGAASSGDQPAPVEGEAVVCSSQGDEDIGGHASLQFLTSTPGKSPAAGGGHTPLRVRGLEHMMSPARDTLANALRHNSEDVRN